MAMLTGSWTRTVSNPFVPEGSRLALPTWGLMLLGLLVGVLQVHLRYPLNIPGHHGLEMMALVLFGRLLSRERWAATILLSGGALSYLVQVPFLSLAHDVKPAVIYLLTGLVADLIFLFTRGRLPMTVNAALIGALAFVTKPVVMYALLLTIGFQSGSFAKHPDWLPFVSHILFGMAGAIGGAALAKAALLRSR